MSRSGPVKTCPLLTVLDYDTIDKNRHNLILLSLWEFKNLSVIAAGITVTNISLIYFHRVRVQFVTCGIEAQFLPKSQE